MPYSSSLSDREWEITSAPTLKQFKDFFNSLVIEPCGDDPLLVIFDPNG